MKTVKTTYELLKIVKKEYIKQLEYIFICSFTGELRRKGIINRSEENRIDSYIQSVVRAGNYYTPTSISCSTDYEARYIFLDLHIRLTK
jgi:hypothetical protein